MTDAMRATIAGLCDELIRVDADCLTRWCQLLHTPGKPSLDAVVASQEPLHRAAEDLRGLCLANSETAHAARRELMRVQVEGEIRHESEVDRVRPAAAREAIRRRWVTERRHIFESRDAITIGLGWPHRGELVMVTTWYGRDGEEITVTGPAVYLSSYDIYNTTHQVWVPELGADHHEGTLLVTWEPRQGSGQWGNADPAGDIGLRVKGAEKRPLPVPRPRWPKPEDIEGGPDPLLSTPVGEQLELFTLAEIP